MNPNRINTPLIATVGVLVVAALAFFGYLLLRPSDEVLVVDEPEITEPEDVSGVSTRLIAKHDFADGMHTVVGEFDLPTPCHLLTIEPHFIDGDESNVELQYALFFDDEEMCAQVITPQQYRVDFEAPEDAAISATVDGSPVVLNLVEVPEGEDIDTFEDYFKG